jgi:ABC-type multidrug transport system ATPase subunit
MKKQKNALAEAEQVPILFAQELEKIVENKNVFEERSRRTLWKVDSLRVETPEFICIAGRNGSGKSTLLRCLLGLQAPTRGRIAWYGHSALSHDVLGYLPEFPILPPALRVGTFLRLLLGRDVDEMLSERNGLLARFTRLSVKEFLHVPANRLSKGQQQRVLLWSALARAPKGLVLDEPFSGLDPWARVELAELLVALKEEHGLFILMSTHELPRALRASCARTWLIESGTLLERSGCALPE